MSIKVSNKVKFKVNKVLLLSKNKIVAQILTFSQRKIQIKIAKIRTKMILNLNSNAN